MRDLCLLFPDRAAWLALAVNGIAGAMEIAEIGAPDVLVSPPAYDAGGNEIAPPVYETLPGWRVDVLIRDDDIDATALAPFIVTPAVRLHRWMGIG